LTSPTPGVSRLARHLPPGSLLILDEAITQPIKRQRYAIDSHITRAIRDLAPRFETSSVPFGDAAQWSLQQLLGSAGNPRPAAILPRRKGSKRMLDDIMVRRLKEDLRQIVGGFPKRETPQVDIDGSPRTRRSCA